MAFTFLEYLKTRDPAVYRELADLGMDLSDPKMKDAFLAQLQAQKVDVKKAALAATANPAGKPDKAQIDADLAAKKQQAMLAGEEVPTGVDPGDWESSVGMLTPTGSAIPNEIGRGNPAVDVAGTLEKGAAQGALPANVGKVKPKWLNMKSVKPPAAAETPDVDPSRPMTPADKAKAKSGPGV